MSPRVGAACTARRYSKTASDQRDSAAYPLAFLKCSSALGLLQAPAPAAMAIRSAPNIRFIRWVRVMSTVIRPAKRGESKAHPVSTWSPPLGLSDLGAGLWRRIDLS